MIEANLRQNNPTILKLKDENGQFSTVKVSLKYLPVKMQLDASESINNMGKLRVDVLDASDLPSADRNGYSDPYCKFELNSVPIFKTKVQKKTLHPAWNEFFEVDVPSRTAAKFRCNVMDWDFGDNDDFLGGTDINLELLDPFKAHEYNLNLDGKSGSIRIRLLFRPDYVTRSRQRTSTFSGTFATPGKVVTGVAGAPIKGVGFAAAGVGKGASFIRHGFRGKKKGEEDASNSTTPIIDGEESPMIPSIVTEENAGPTPGGSLRRASGFADNGASAPGTPSSASPHTRTKSFGASSRHSAIFAGSPDSPPTGTAYFTILSASGYPTSAAVMVHIKQLGPKSKIIHSTEHIKDSSGVINFNEKKETFKVACSPDTQFQINVKGHKPFGRDDDLGEGMLVVDESGKGEGKTCNVGGGKVVVKSSFVPAPQQENGMDSPRTSSAGFGRLLARKGDRDREGRGSRDVTPTLS